MTFTYFKPILTTVAIFYLAAFQPLFSQSEKPKLYLIAGQGSDYRLFKNYNFDGIDTTVLYYIIPEYGDDMATYARRLMAQMDTSRPFYLMGSSLGGMLACEIAKVTQPEKVILLASAKCREELPLRYRFQKYVPLYKLFNGRTLRYLAMKAQPIVEPECNGLERATFQTMLSDKHPDFMKRSIAMIINWENKEVIPNVVHFHGTSDHTIPFRRVKNVIVLPKASHMMTLTRSAELEPILRDILVAK